METEEVKTEPASAQEISFNDFLSDLKTPTDAPPPKADPPPGQPSSPGGSSSASAGSSEPPKQPLIDKERVAGMTEAEFSAWAATNGLDVAVSLAAGMIAKEDPAMFAANKSHLKKLEEIMAVCCDRYQWQISPMYGLITAAGIAFAPPVMMAFQIKNKKGQIKKAESGDDVTDAQENKNRVGRPTKVQQKINELQEQINSLKSRK